MNPLTGRVLRCLTSAPVDMPLPAGYAGKEMIRHTLNIQPALTERPGLLVCVIVTRDLLLRPYYPLFFNRGTSR